MTPGKLGSTVFGGVCGEEARMWHGGKGSMNQFTGLASSLFEQGPQSRGWGDMGHPMLRVQGPEWDADSNHADPCLSKPNLPDEDGDDENSGQDEEGKDPEGHQDGHLLQGVAAVWDREAVTAKGCHSLRHPGDPIARSCTPSTPATHGYGARDPSHYSQPHMPRAGRWLRAVPAPACHPHLYSLMGSGLGAWEGSSARLSRLVSVVVSSLAVVAGSGRTERMGITHPK